MRTKTKHHNKVTKKTNDNFFRNLNDNSSTFSLNHIKPMTPNQEEMFAQFDEGYNLFVHGYAGTGKTLLSMYLGLREVISDSTIQDNMVIIRSVVPSRDMGFLPGKPCEKSMVFEIPYSDICSMLYSRPNAYEALKTQKILTFTTTSFLRGTTFKNAVVYVDEIQNMADNEIHTIMTRIGEGCRLIVSGDVRQTDLLKDCEKLGCMTFIKTMALIPSFKRIEFGIDDILRSSFVRDYIVARTEILSGDE